MYIALSDDGLLEKAGKSKTVKRTDVSLKSTMAAPISTSTPAKDSDSGGVKIYSSQSGQLMISSNNKHMIGKVLEYYGDGIPVSIDTRTFIIKDQVCYVNSDASYETYTEAMKTALTGDNILFMNKVNFIQSRLLQYRFRIIVETPEDGETHLRIIQPITHCVLNFPEYFTSINILWRKARIYNRNHRSSKTKMSWYIYTNFTRTNPKEICTELLKKDSNVFELFINVLNSIAVFKSPLNKTRQKSVIRYEHAVDVESEIKYFLSLDFPLTQNTVNNINLTDSSIGSNSDNSSMSS